MVAVPPAQTDAFISYSTCADSRVGTALERGLERLARPWNRLRAVSVFRDQTDLSLTPDLWASLEQRLLAARYLILLASEESASSYWVSKEIETWCEHKGTSNLMLVWTGGTLRWDKSAGDFDLECTAIPPGLRGKLGGEPLYLDLRWAREAPELSLQLSTFRAAVAQIAGPIRGVAPDELEGEDIRNHRRLRRLRRLAIAALATLTVVAGISAVLAIRNAQRADRRTREAVARQVGLASLDVPSSRIDEAMLTALAAGNLASDDDPQRFLATQQLIGRYPRLTRILQAGPPGEVANIHSLGFESDGDKVATVTSASGEVQVVRWANEASPASATAIEDAGGGADAAPMIAISDTGATLIQANGSLFAVADTELSVAANDVVAADPGVGLVLRRTADEQLSLHSLTTGRDLATIDAAQFVSAFGDGRAAVLADGRLTLLNAGSDATTAQAISSEAPSATVIALGPVDETAVVQITADERLLRWRLDGGALVLGQTIAVPEDVGVIQRVEVGPDGARVLIVGSQATAVIDLDDGDTALAVGGGTNVVVADPSQRFVVLGGGRLAVWDLLTGQRVFAAAQATTAAAWSGPCEESCRLVTAGISIDVFDPFAETQVRLVDDASALTVAISADGSQVLSAGWGGTVAEWSLDPKIDDSSRQPVAVVELTNPTGCAATIVARSPDGSVAAGVDPATATVRLCETAAGSQLAAARLNPGAGAISALAVDNAGNVVVGREPGMIDYYRRNGTSFEPGRAIDARLGGEDVTITALAMRNDTVVAGLGHVRAAVNPAGVFIWPIDRLDPTTFSTTFADIAAVALLDDQAAAMVVALRDAKDGAVTIQLWESASRRRIGRAFPVCRATSSGWRAMGRRSWVKTPTAMPIDGRSIVIRRRRSAPSSGGISALWNGRPSPKQRWPPTTSTHPALRQRASYRCARWQSRRSPRCLGPALRRRPIVPTNLRGSASGPGRWRL